MTDGQRTAHHQQLVQQGRFTDAAMFSSLYDKSPWEGQSKEFVNSPNSLVPTEKQPKEEEKTNTEPATHHNVAFPTAHTQKTSLDGKWHTHLGWTLMLNGNYASAAAAYREALRQNATLAQAYLGLGITLRNQGQTEDAVQAYQKALEYQPGYAAALVHLGYMYLDGHPGQPNFAKAKQLFDQASREGDPFATIALLDLKTRARE